MIKLNLFLVSDSRLNLANEMDLQVSDDGQLPRTICPGCTIQIEATVEFITLIINGQVKIILNTYF